MRRLFALLTGFRSFSTVLSHPPVDRRRDSRRFASGSYSGSAGEAAPQTTAQLRLRDDASLSK